jgi:hypothetical protein
LEAVAVVAHGSAVAEAVAKSQSSSVMKLVAALITQSKLALAVSVPISREMM